MRLTASNFWYILQAIANNKQVDYINVSEYIVSLTMLDVFTHDLVSEHFLTAYQHNIGYAVPYH